MTIRKKAAGGVAKTAVAGKAPPAVTVVAAAAAPATPSELQLKTWDRAVQLFTQKKFPEACEAFRDTARGPAAHIADKARSYQQICERKMASVDVDFRTAEDHFNYGVERLNARDIERARFHLGRASGMEPDTEYIVYTLALCCGIAGDAGGAYENLKHAIELEPRNRILARQDPEFSALAAQFPALRELLGTALGSV